MYGGYQWPESGGNSTAMLSCVHGRQEDGQPRGFAIRHCQTGGMWKEVDFSQCRDSELKNVLLFILC